MRRKYNNPSTVFAGLAALSLLLVGCSGDTDSEESNENSAAGSGGTCDLAPDYPSGPIEIIVGYPAGGGTDSVGRLIADGLSDALDTQVNVVNRDGGGGVVGAEAMANAEPDGHTLGVLGSDVILSHWMGQTDITLDSYTSIGQVNRDGSALLVAEESEWETADDLIAAIEENPGELTASGVGQGGIWHIGMLDMLLSSGLDADAVTWVPSEGAAPAMQQLVAGGVDFTTNSLGEAITQLEGDQVRALAVASEERESNFPDVPTFEEATGESANTGVRRGLGGPAGVDENIANELSCHLEGIVESDEFIETMDNLGLSIAYLNGEEFDDGLAADDERLGELLDEAGLLPE